MEPEGPDREDAGAYPNESGRPGPLLPRVLRETPDLILLLEPSDGSFRCRTAIGSLPGAPVLTRLKGLKLDAILPRDLLQHFEDQRHEAIRRRDAVRYEERVGSGDDALVLEAAVTPVFEEDGRADRFFWSVRDVTGEWSAHRALQRAEELVRRLEGAPAEAEAELAAQREALASERRALGERLRGLEEEADRLEEMWASIRETHGEASFLFREAAVGAAWTDRDGGILDANRLLAALVGRPRDELLGTNVLDLLPADERGDAEHALADLRAERLGSTSVGSRLVRAEGDPAPVHVTITADGGAGEARRLLWQFEDRTERRDLRDLLAHQALHDPLTGMPNRALFLDRLERALTRLDRRPGTIAVIVVDLDRFEAVNDELGHAGADRLLAQIAERLGQGTRATDTVARLESDEFAVLCEDLGGPQDAAALAERLRASVEQAALMVDGRGIQVGMSIGIALATETTDRPEWLLRDATGAMREAKAGGRGRTEIFDAARRERVAVVARTDGELAGALERGELRVFYQPQIDLRRGVIVGAEALVRWQHPERGLLVPEEFVPLAEESGLIVPLGAWVFEEACRQSRLWMGDEPLVTWVNVSPRQLSEGDLPDRVSKALAETDAEPAGMAIEVTEGVLVEEAGASVSTLREIHDLGLRIGIDDFGKGFSSLTYLRELPVDAVKLDMGFVHGLGAREEDEAIATAVVNLARAMNLTSVAEGVETHGQLARLRELGCDLAQGYLFASPQPPEVVQQLLTQDLRW